MATSKRPEPSIEGLRQAESNMRDDPKSVQSKVDYLYHFVGFKESSRSDFSESDERMAELVFATLCLPQFSSCMHYYPEFPKIAREMEMGSFLKDLWSFDVEAKELQTMGSEEGARILKEKAKEACLKYPHTPGYEFFELASASEMFRICFSISNTDGDCKYPELDAAVNMLVQHPCYPSLREASKAKGACAFLKMGVDYAERYKAFWLGRKAETKRETRSKKEIKRRKADALAEKETREKADRVFELIKDFYCNRSDHSPYYGVINRKENGCFGGVSDGFEGVRLYPLKKVGSRYRYLYFPFCGEGRKECQCGEFRAIESVACEIGFGESGEMSQAYKPYAPFSKTAIAPYAEDEEGKWLRKHKPEFFSLLCPFEDGKVTHLPTFEDAVNEDLFGVRTFLFGETKMGLLPLFCDNLCKCERYDFIPSLDEYLYFLLEGHGGIKGENFRAGILPKPLYGEAKTAPDRREKKRYTTLSADTSVHVVEKDEIALLVQIDEKDMEALAAFIKKTHQGLF